MMTTDETRWYSLKDAANYLGITTDTLMVYMLEGVKRLEGDQEVTYYLRANNIAPGHRRAVYRFRKEWLDEFEEKALRIRPPNP